jgi:hypothetical protein
VAFNLGKIDMKKAISVSVATGRFVRSMNKYVVEHRIEYVYGVDDSLMAFVARYWPAFPGSRTDLRNARADSDIGISTLFWIERGGDGEPSG